jgi:cytochrome c peroxidase
MIPRPRTRRVVIVGSLAALAAAGLVVSVLAGARGARDGLPPSAEAFSVRGADKVKAAYADWARRHEADGGDRHVVIALGYWKALSAEHTTATGLATLDLVDGAVSVRVTGLPRDRHWDVWLVDNQPGPRQSVRPEPADTMLRVGRLVPGDDAATLATRLGRAALRELHVDLVVVTPAGGDPATGGVLFGAPALFQRLYTARRSEGLLARSDFAGHPGIAVRRHWAARLGVARAEATGEATSLSGGGGSGTGIFVNEDVVFNELVARGAHLFLNERFRGNGRTCATCHRKEASFTIDVNFIASLPDDDPLFVAEFTPALAFTPFGPKFEVPVLMRKHGLIVENVDGMSDLVNRYTMRGVPHTLGLRQSLTPANDGTTQPPNQRTGWSGDGAPGNGTLRDFATGAVTQHFPKTLNRVPGEDFRLPTDAELDAMEAFQLTLGRQVDLVLPLNLRDPQVRRGQELFMAGTNQGGGGCHACHGNAGANATFGGGGNRNFNTGVENQRDRPHVLTLQALNLDLTPGIPSNVVPRDGGFGQAEGEGPDGTGFGSSTFNTVSLVEAADSGPFFHDNSVATIEGAVEFYNSQEFADARNNGVRLNLGATQVEAIAAFLRAINALDNIREAREAATAARTVSTSRPRVANELLKQAITEATDAMSVLFARGLHTGAVKALEDAIRHFSRASSGGLFPRIDRSQIDRGLTLLARARADLAQ